MKLPDKFVVPWSGRGDGYTNSEIAVVVDTMKRADPLTQGRYQAEFERRFKTMVGAPHAFAVSSATAALELCALLTRVGPGDEIVIPGHTFAASAIPFARTGARLVWADIDKDTRLATAATLRKVVTSKTKVIVAVHLYGLVADMDPILELGRQNNIFIVEDAAQAIGVRYRGRWAGTLGDFGCFSFHTHKNISTLGEGGMLTVRDERMAKLVPGLRHNGMRDFPPGREKYWNPAMGDVDFDIEGVWPYNFCIGEVQCALGTKLLERLGRVNARRRSRGLKIIAALKDFPELRFQSIPEGCEHSFHLLAARCDADRDAFIERMACKHKVKVVVQYNPLYRYPLFAKAGFGKASCPNTDAYYNSMVSFPFHAGLTDAQIDYMIASAKETLTYLRKHPVPSGGIGAKAGAASGPAKAVAQ